MDRIDERLREALEPRPEAVGRIARAALATPEPVLRWLPAAAATALLGVMALLLWPQPPIPPVPRIQNVGEVLIVKSPDGEGSIVRSGGSEPESASTGIVMIRFGGAR